MIYPGHSEADAAAVVAPRHGFMPPGIVVAPLDSDIATPQSPIPLMTDLMGEQIVPDAAAIRLGWSEHAFHLSADADHAPTALTPDLAPDHSDFWRQEHVDLHVLRPDGGMLQFILAPDGRVMDSAGHWRTNGVLTTDGAMTDDGWSAALSIPWHVLGQENPRPGLTLWAQMAHLRWHGVAPRFAVFSATPLGFDQRERFGLFALADKTPGITLDRVNFAGAALLTGANNAELVLCNHGCRPLTGRLRVRCEHGPGTDRVSTDRTIGLTPGPNVVSAETTFVNISNFVFDLRTGSSNSTVVPRASPTASPMRQPRTRSGSIVS